MKLRGLRTEVVEHDARGRARRREAFVTTVFAMGPVPSNAKPIWSLMSYAFTGETRRTQMGAAPKPEDS